MERQESAAIPEQREPPVPAPAVLTHVTQQVAAHRTTILLESVSLEAVTSSAPPETDTISQQVERLAALLLREMNGVHMHGLVQGRPFTPPPDYTSEYGGGTMGLDQLR